MSHRRNGIPHRIDATWTPEQAAAVYECLSELTETILSRYGMAIQELYKNDRCTGPESSADPFDQHPELPF